MLSLGLAVALFGCGASQPLDASDAVGLEVRADGRSVGLVKSERGWRLSDDPSTPLDPSALRNVVSVALGKIPCVPVQGATSDLSEYGLRPAVGTIVVNLGARGSVSFDVGHPSVDGHATYVHRDGAVCLSASPLYDAMAWPAHRYLDRRAAAFDPAHVVSLHYTAPEGQFFLSRNGSVWWVREHGPANLNGVDELVYGLAALKVQRWGANADAWGVPTHTIAWAENGAAAESLRMWDDGSELLRVCRGTALCGYANSEQWTLRQAGLADVLAHKPLGDWLSAATEIRVTRMGKQQRLTRLGGRWTGVDGSDAFIHALQDLTWSGGMGAPRGEHEPYRLELEGDRGPETLYMWEAEPELWAFSTQDGEEGEWTMTGPLAPPWGRVQ